MGRVWWSWSWEKLDQGLQHSFSFFSPSLFLVSLPFPFSSSSLSLSQSLLLSPLSSHCAGFILSCLLCKSSRVLYKKGSTFSWAPARNSQERGLYFLWVICPFVDSHSRALEYSQEGRVWGWRCCSSSVLPSNPKVERWGNSFFEEGTCDCEQATK